MQRCLVKASDRATLIHESRRANKAKTKVLRMRMRRRWHKLRAQDHHKAFSKSKRPGTIARGRHSTDAVLPLYIM